MEAVNAELARLQAEVARLEALLADEVGAREAADPHKRRPSKRTMRGGEAATALAALEEAREGQRTALGEAEGERGERCRCKACGREGDW